MAAFYYLISSLPMLKTGEEPPLTSDEFLAACHDFLPVAQIEELDSLSLVPPEDYADSSTATATAWYDWETCFRNALVHLRSKGKGPDAEKYLRGEADFFSEIEKGVQEAFAKASPLEMENALDVLRWSRLDDMEVGHMFDFTKLCVFKLKLMLCEKQFLLNKEQGSENFDKIVNHIYGQNPSAPVQIEA